MSVFWNNLFDLDRRETVGEILFYRLFELVMLYWIVLFAWEWGFYIQKIGDVVLPLGIAEYVDVSFMFDNGLSILNAALITAAVAVGFFRLNRWGYFAGFLLIHLQYVSRYSLGEISHGSNVAGLALFAMAMGAVAFRNPKWTRRTALGLTLFFLGWGYTTAAFSKLIASGPMWVDGGHMWMWISERAVDVMSKQGVPDLNWLQSILVESYPLATLTLTFGLVVEFFGFLVWFRKTRPYIMTLLITMHIGILLSMRISFPANDTILVLLAYPWGNIIDYGLEQSAGLKARISRWIDHFPHRIA